MRYALTVTLTLDLFNPETGSIGTLYKRVTCELDAEGPEEARAQFITGIMELADQQWPLRTRMMFGAIEMQQKEQPANA
jgi:hypothetical protein